MQSIHITSQTKQRQGRSAYATGRGLSLAELRALEAWDASEDASQVARDEVRCVFGTAGLRSALSY